jgi:hypothetical protein
MKTIVYVLKLLKPLNFALNKCPIFNIFTSLRFYITVYVVYEQLCIVVRIYVYNGLRCVFDSLIKG